MDTTMVRRGHMNVQKTQSYFWAKETTVWTQFDARYRFTWWDCKLDCSLRKRVRKRAVL
jgi:hypothetical protein